jgi:transposase-like protein
MGNVTKIKGNRKPRKPLKHARVKDVLADKFEGLEGPIDSQHLLISMLLPPAVKQFMEDCSREVEQLCGDRYKHGKTNQRWGSQNGSIVLGNHHVAVEKLRVRGKDGKEIPLQTYEAFQNPKLFEQAVFNEGVKRVSQRDYKKGIPIIANSFGFKKSTISKRWQRATIKKIAELQTRDLRPMNIRAVFIDGKRFKKHGVILALGVGHEGRKHVLGIYQANTENSQSCLELLNNLEGRGLPESGLLFIVDGGSGLNKALEEKYAVHDRKRRRAVRIRCHIHKWWNIEKALGEQAHKASGLFWALRDAENMAEAKAISDRLESVLRDLNLSALESYLEAKEDLLGLHDLKLSKSLKRFFSTTNAIESLNSIIEEDMRRVKHWRSSGHFQRWLGTFCLAAETRMNRIRGNASLPGLWVLLRTIGDKIDTASEVA